ncbi:MAG: LysR family transcriptional regulator [Gammaproteobacteria bacterium]|nr:LysR family transcriptional regulator [Gammaproteobacteria bacterium]
MDYNQLVVFIKVVEAGSFSGAAKVLGFPRSTVSRKVSLLEESLGIRLLQRSTRKLSLTPAGQDYYEKCSHALRDIERANDEVTEAKKQPSGVIRITASLSSQNGFLCEWINEFLGLYENVTGEIILSDDNIDLIATGIDVAFRIGVLEESTLIARKLGKTQLVLCASPQYLSNSPPLDNVNNLKDHYGISYGGSQTNSLWRLESQSGTKVVSYKERVSVNSMIFAVNACVAGLGVALLPIATIDQYVKTNKLVKLFEEYSTDVGGMYLVYPTKKHLSTTVRAFIDFIIEKSGRGLPWPT